MFPSPYFRGTKDFKVEVARLQSGPWLRVTGKLPDPKTFADAGIPVEKMVLRSSDWLYPMSGRYAKFVCNSWYGEGCALQYIGFVFTMV